MDPIDNVLAALDSRDCKPRRCGEGWQAQCPAHTDNRASLSIAEGKDGRALVKCHAGCRFEEVLAALEFRRRDLFPEKPSSSGSRIVKAYPYTDESGALLYEVVRFDPKDFRQRRPDGKGGHVWNMKGVRRVLYRLLSVATGVKQGAIIYVVEGEKDADNLAELGLLATTSVMGAGKWRREYAEQLRGAGRVVVIPDKDGPGRMHAAQVVRTLAGVVPDVRILELPGAGKDVSDWLAASGSRAELEPLAELAPTANVETASKKMFRQTKSLNGTNLHELAALLESPPEAELICGGEINYDEMNLAPSVGGVPFDEAKYLDVQRRIEQFYSGPKGGSLQLPKERVRDAIHLAAAKRSYHPVREYLRRLKWDGVERITSVLEEVLGIEPTELSQAIVRKWFISAVARPMQPGCKTDHVLILVGPQNFGKSSFFVVLVGSKWFSDSVIDIQNRDSYLLLRRVWILEWSELEAMQRARHQDAVKAFITSSADVYRAPYARATESVPRTSIIVGTTNADGFLADATGNRRYWPLRVAKRIDLEKLAQWRDQLWAEAVVAFRKGEQWWLTPEMETRLQRAHEEFEQEDPWTDMVLEFVCGYVGDITTSMVLEKAVNKPAGQWTRSDEMRVAAILKREGWVQHRVRVGTDRVRRWSGPTNGRDRDEGLGQKGLLVSRPAQPSQVDHPIHEEEEEEGTARARGVATPVEGLLGDVGAFAGTVGTAGRGVR